MEELKAIIEAAKETTKEAIAAGADYEQCFNFLTEKFGNENARLIIASIALDLGLKEETATYLANF